MLDKDILDLEKRVEEARQVLIELNNQYNELLTKEHLNKQSKRVTPTNFSELKSELRKELDELQKENNISDEESYERGKVEILHSFLWFVFLFIGLAHVVSLPIAMVLLLINAVIKGFRLRKIMKKYHPEEYIDKKKDGNKNTLEEKNANTNTKPLELTKENAKEVQIKLSPKEEKDDLYERVYQARCNYHNLRKELESKKLDKELDEDRKTKEGESSISTEYEAYVNYINNMFIDNNESIKMYELKNEDYK